MNPPVLMVAMGTGVLFELWPALQLSNTQHANRRLQTQPMLCDAAVWKCFTCSIPIVAAHLTSLAAKQSSGRKMLQIVAGLRMIWNEP
jgi:hypothetical protein